MLLRAGGAVNIRLTDWEDHRSRPVLVLPELCCKRGAVTVSLTPVTASCRLDMTWAARHAPNPARATARTVTASLPTPRLRNQHARCWLRRRTRQHRGTPAPHAITATASDTLQIEHVTIDHVASVINTTAPASSRPKNFYIERVYVQLDSLNIHRTRRTSRCVLPKLPTQPSAGHFSTVFELSSGRLSVRFLRLLQSHREFRCFRGLTETRSPPSADKS
jgi:hypothetical protein